MKNATYLFTGTMVGIMFGLYTMRLYNVWQDPAAYGIHAAPSGEAVYIAGEACTVNMTPQRSITEMNNDFVFCTARHLNTLNK